MSCPPDAKTSPGAYRAALVDVEAVAALLNVSAAHVRRLSRSGHTPQPVRLGQLLRWNAAELEEWLSAGCPDCQERGGL